MLQFHLSAVFTCKLLYESLLESLMLLRNMSKCCNSQHSLEKTHNNVSAHWAGISNKGGNARKCEQQLMNFCRMLSVLQMILLLN